MSHFSYFILFSLVVLCVIEKETRASFIIIISFQPRSCEEEGKQTTTLKCFLRAKEEWRDDDAKIFLVIGKLKKRSDAYGLVVLKSRSRKTQFNRINQSINRWVTLRLCVRTTGLTRRLPTGLTRRPRS